MMKYVMLKFTIVDFAYDSDMIRWFGKHAADMC